MKMIDYFFYVIAKSFTMSKDDLDDSDARMKASTFLALWIIAFAGVLVSALGLIIDNPVSALLKSAFSEVIIIALAIMAIVFVHIRYYEPDRYIRTVEWRKGLSKAKSTFIYILFLVLFWSMPIVLFITFRLYVIGHIKWW